MRRIMTLHVHTRPTSLIAAGLLLACTGCAGMGKSVESGFMYKNLPVAQASAMAGEGHSVTLFGKATPLSGPEIKAGDKLRDALVTKPDLSLVHIGGTDGKGRVRIISVVPSLDTKVCEQQTHYLSEKNNGLDRMIELITISIDTPFAQKRFADEAKVNNVTFLSDYRDAAFGKAHGLFLKDPHILTRAIMVVDKDNTVRHLQLTPDLGQLPDMDDAFRFARSLINAS